MKRSEIKNKTFKKFVNPACRCGNRAIGVMIVGGGVRAVCKCCRKFWEQFPIVKASKRKKFPDQTDPKCRHCGSSEVTYHDGQGDSYCAECGHWQADN